MTTDNAEWAARLRRLHDHGSVVKYVHEEWGINSRLDALQAVVLRAKLIRLDGWNAARRAAAGRYARLLAAVPGVRVPVSAEGNTDVWHLYVVRVADRDRVLAELGEAGVGAGLHYPIPLHRTPAYAHLGFGQGRFPVAERAATQILSLPMFPHLRPDQQVEVANVLRQAVAG